MLDGSTLAKHFSSEHDQFLETLRANDNAPALASFAARWLDDPRPWAREQLFAYVHAPMNCPGHEALVRRLFKGAEARSDHEIMGAFLVAFDRLVRREVQTRWHWDGGSWTEEVLVARGPIIAHMPADRSWRPWVSAAHRLFSTRSRLYLRKRAWRHFRRLGFQDPEAYLDALAPALMRYRDDDLADGEALLDSWVSSMRCIDTATHSRSGETTLASPPAGRWGR